ncbi:hypothetical protein DIPPA_35811 [Diplonema papillatum]|nr:hypothetical protein DIPPA_35811 [Diplonema papillatum]
MRLGTLACQVRRAGGSIAKEKAPSSSPAAAHASKKGPAAQARAEKLFATHVPLKGPQDTRAARWQTGPRAGTLYNQYEDIDKSSWRNLLMKLTGSNLQELSAKREDDYLEKTIRQQQLMRAELLQESTKDAVWRHAALWLWPTTVLLFCLVLVLFEPFWNPKVNQRIRREERDKFVEVSDQLATMKIDSTIERIRDIEAELQKRGVPHQPFDKSSREPATPPQA